MKGNKLFSKVVSLAMILSLLLSISSCSKGNNVVGGVTKKTESDRNDMEIVNTFEITTREEAGETGVKTCEKYYEMSDGTWKTDDYVYKYRLELTGRMGGASKDMTFVYLSNTDDITFEKAYMAAGLSSNSYDYFDPSVAILVGFGIRE